MGRLEQGQALPPSPQDKSKERVVGLDYYACCFNHPSLALFAFDSDTSTLSQFLHSRKGYLLPITVKNGRFVSDDDRHRFQFARAALWRMSRNHVARLARGVRCHSKNCHRTPVFEQRIDQTWLLLFGTIRLFMRVLLQPLLFLLLRAGLCMRNLLIALMLCMSMFKQFMIVAVRDCYIQSVWHGVKAICDHYLFRIPCMLQFTIV